MAELGRINALSSGRTEDDIDEEEEEVKDTKHPERIDLSENYQFARVIVLMALKKDIAEERRRKQSRATGFSFLALFGVGVTQQPLEVQQSNTIEDYWNDNSTPSPSNTASSHIVIHPGMMFDVRILKLAFKAWIELKKMRIARKIASKNAEQTIMIQSAVRRFLERIKFTNQEKEKLKKDKEFRDFCVSMEKGVTIDMVSKKRGVALKRTIKIADGCLVYKTSAWHSSSYPCNHIYAVNKGLSPHQYGPEFNGHKTNSFHLLLLGDVVLDFCARDHQQYKTLMDGFIFLRMMLFTQAPFYIDEKGFPRRANESIITRALEIAKGKHNITSVGGGDSAAEEKDSPEEAKESDRLAGSSKNGTTSAAVIAVVKGPISEADDMRLLTAKNLLESEYKVWEECYRKDKEEWMEENHFKHKRGKGKRGSTSHTSGSVMTGDTNKTDTNKSNDNDKNRRRSFKSTFTNMFRRSTSGKENAPKPTTQPRGSVGSLGSTINTTPSAAAAEAVPPPPPSSSAARSMAPPVPPVVPTNVAATKPTPAPVTDEEEDEEESDDKDDGDDESEESESDGEGSESESSEEESDEEDEEESEED